MRTVALDVHKRFAEVAVHEERRAASAGADRDRPAAGVRRVVGPERSRGVGVDGDDVGDRRTARRACGSGDGVESDAHAGDRVGEGQDRQDRRQGARAARRGGLPARGVGAGRGHARVAAAGRASLEPGAPAHAVAQPGPCGAGAQSDRGAGDRRVRPGRPALAGRVRAARARARAGRQQPAPARRAGRRGRARRARPGRAGARRSRGAAADDDPRCRRDHRAGVGRGDRRRHALSRARATWSAISVWTRGSASPGRRPLATGTSLVPARRTPAGC